jgi:hypothetical protein
VPVRILRAKNASISGEASWPSSVASLRRRMIVSRLLVAVTIAGPVIAARPWPSSAAGASGGARS